MIINKNIVRRLSILSIAFIGLIHSAFAQSGATFTEPKKAYVQAEVMPQFEGGEQELLRFLAKNIRYPEAAKKASESGVAAISFIVEKNGSISNVEVNKSAGATLDSEAIRVVKLTNGKWKPGKQDGKPVRVKLTVPVLFTASN